MSPARIAAARALVHVFNDDAPGTLTSHLLRLERLWRAGNSDVERARAARLTRSELSTCECFDCEIP
jgi:hypothetical protein